MTRELIDYLAGFVTENRLATFRKVIESRTRHITVVLEDLYQMHNASAVLRTCECFGIQDVHVVENKNTFSINPDIALGASKWLTLYKHNLSEVNPTAICSKLRSMGYKIVATIPGEGAFNLEEFNPLEKTALLFGTELEGLSRDFTREADEMIKIPMFGFTESFNISVSAGIILHQLLQKVRNSNITWKLPPEEADEILLNWLKESVKNSNLIINQYIKEHER